MFLTSRLRVRILLGVPFLFGISQIVIPSVNGYVKPKLIIRKCNHHDNTEFILEGNGYYRCKKCRVNSVSKRRRNVKKKLVEYFGGKCQVERCGYNRCVEALDFHHLNPEEKGFRVSSGSTISFEKLLEEAKKCVLVCANCHREIENKIILLADSTMVVRSPVKRRVLGSSPSRPANLNEKEKTKKDKEKSLS